MSRTSSKRIFFWGSPASPFIREQVQTALTNGYKVDWYYHQPHKSKGVTSHTLPSLLARFFLVRSIFEPLFIFRLLKTLQPDLLHIFYVSKGLSAFPLSRCHPLIVTPMGSDISPKVGYRGLYRPFIRHLLSSADLILSKSLFMDAAILKIGDYQSKVRRLAWGIDLTAFRRANNLGSNRIKRGPSDRRVVFFDPRSARRLYNKHVILSAFGAYLRTTSRQNDVLLISEQGASPDYLQELKTITEKMGIGSNVNFLGHIPYESMPGYYAMADVTISVPSSDGLPQTLFEAMAAGNALIISDLPQYAEIIDAGMIARLVPPGNVEALTEAMVKTVEAGESLGKAGKVNRKIVEKSMDLNTSQAALARLYQSTLASQT